MGTRKREGAKNARAVGKGDRLDLPKSSLEEFVMRPGIANLHILARLALATTGGLMLALCVAPRPARAPGAPAKADPPPFRRFWGPRFSEPVDGLRLGLRAPGRLPVAALAEMTFRLECLNSGTEDRALDGRWS